MAAEEVRVCRRAPVAIKQEQDDDSDAEEPNLGPKKSDEQIIHSGHFMVSSPHSEHPPKKGYDFDTVNMQTCQTYCFGKTSTSHFSIDASLTKLFECMTLAYSGKLVSPKWKNFKGLKLLWRDKIRLNNAIWRAWYMQYVERRDNPVCHFVTPLDGSVDMEDHRRPELQKHKDEDLSSLVKDDEVGAWRANRKGRDTPVPMEQDIDIEMLMSEFTDTLFSTLASHQPVAWPNPREIAHAGNADMIQPGLIPLQPNLDFMDTFEPFQAHAGNADMIQPGLIPLQPNLDFMDTFEPFQDFFPSVRSSFFPSFSIPSVSSMASSNCPTQTSILTSPISSASLSQEPIPPPVTPALSNTSNKNCSSAVNAFGQTAEFRSQTPLANQQTFLPVFPPLVPSVPCAADAARVPAPPSPPPQTVQPTAVPQNGAGGVTQASFPSAETPKFGFSSTLQSSVITHTASGQSPSLILTTRPQAGPRDASVMPHFQPQPSAPAQTFALPKPVQLKGTRAKPLQKIVPAPTPLVFKNAFIAPASFPGQTSAVIVTPAPLKSEGVSPPSVVLAPTAIGRSRRINHISAEQKRRFNIKIGFDTLNTLVPVLKSQSNSKPISNAATLQKTVEYIAKLQQERAQMQEEAKRLKDEIDTLNTSINCCQQQLPATGVPITRQRFDHMREMFDDYVKNRTLQNWKFWIVSFHPFF
ncbi:MLX-interacting protein [Acipenser ruthenus]|uniref:MLX-interacting protein n=1 Tax=Acipenser ruthenus TaxID=7906 RepID=A0A444UU05_ACIRT|nr:MLX-interacting protein [Acipenser ruthenus]